jgi:hypothetical protein
LGDWNQAGDWLAVASNGDFGFIAVDDLLDQSS